MRLPDKQRNEMENTSATNDNDSGKFGAKTIAMIVGAMVVGGLVVALFFMTGEDKTKDNPPVAAVAEQKEDTAQKEISPAPPPAPTPPPQKADTNEPKNYYEDGQYKVGADIPAGEYLAVGTGYIELAADSKGKGGSVIFNDNISEAQRYIEARDGEYLKITGRLKLYSEKDAPKIDAKETVPAGQYKVGIDIPHGEYKVSTDGNGSATITKTSRGTGGGNTVSHKYFQNAGSFYITVENGQYLQLKHAEAQLVK